MLERCCTQEQFIHAFSKNHGGAAAGIVPVDNQGRHVHFHALRHTFCTRLALANTLLQVAMKLMRHPDAKLTTQVYLDAWRLPTAEAVRALPPLVPTITKAQQRAHSIWSRTNGFRA